VALAGQAHQSLLRNKQKKLRTTALLLGIGKFCLNYIRNFKVLLFKTTKQFSLTHIEKIVMYKGGFLCFVFLLNEKKKLFANGQF